MALLEEALAAGGTTDSPSRARLLSRLATCLYFSDAAERRATLSRQAVEIAERVGEPVTLALVLHNAHFAVLGPDSLDERTAMASRIIALGETTGRKDLTFAGHYWRLVDALERGDIAARRRLAAAPRGAGRSSSGSRSIAGASASWRRCARCSPAGSPTPSA